MASLLFKYQAIGSPLIPRALQGPSVNCYPGILLEEKYVFRIGTVAVEEGITKASFVDGDRIQNNTAYIKNRVMILLDFRDHTKDGYFQWSELLRARDPRNTTTPTYNGNRVVYSPALQTIGSYNKEKKMATFAVGDRIVNVVGDEIRSLLILINIKNEVPPRCTCHSCPIFNFPVKKGFPKANFVLQEEDKWMEMVDREPFKERNMVRVNEMDQFVSCWFVGGKAVFGKSWKCDRIVHSDFPTAPNINNGSFLVLQAPNNRMSAFKYSWRTSEDGRIPLRCVKVGDSVLGVVIIKKVDIVVTVSHSTGSCFYRYRGQVMRSNAPPTGTKFLVKEDNLVSEFTIKGTESEFVVDELLGKGTYGSVHRVWNKNDKKKLMMAMKVERKRDGGHMKIAREVMVLKAMNHSAWFPKLVEVGIHDDIHFVVMDLLGKTIKQLIDQSPLPFQQVIDIATQTLNALRDLHHAGFVHQDLKPENFAFGIGDNSKKVYLFDFGLSRKYVNAQNDLKNVKANTYQGTAEYASIAALQYKDVFPKDDLQNWSYVLIDMLRSLEWTGEERPEILESKSLAKRGTTSLFFYKYKWNGNLDAIINYCMDCRRDEEIQYDWILELLEKMSRQHQ